MLMFCFNWSDTQPHNYNLRVDHKNTCVLWIADKHVLKNFIAMILKQHWPYLTTNILTILWSQCSDSHQIGLRLYVISRRGVDNIHIAPQFHPICSLSTTTSHSFSLSFRLLGFKIIWPMPTVGLSSRLCISYKSDGKPEDCRTGKHRLICVWCRI